MSVLDRSVLTHPERLAAVERARRVLPGISLPLDRVARLAADLTGAPIGLICLVGEDEEFLLGGSGLPETLAPGRRSRGPGSLCTYVVAAGRPTAVADVTAEPRLLAHPLTARYGGGSFAGVPLCDADGQAVGSLAVVDTVPRAWSAAQIATIAKVAEMIGPVPVPGGTTVLPEIDSTTLLDSVREAFVAIDDRGRIVGWNRAAEETFGWSAAEALGQPMDRLILVRPVAEEFNRGIAMRLETPAEQPTPENVVARHRDGREFPAETVTYTLPTPNGPVVVGFLTDVSPLADAERNANEQRGFLSAVLDSVLTMVAAVDGHGTVKVVNRAMRELYGLPEQWSPEDLAPLWAAVGYPDGRPMPPEETPIMRALRGEVIRAAHIVLRVRDHPDRSLMVNAQPITADDGRRLGSVAALHDVTDAQRAERFRACELEVVKALAYAGDVGSAGRKVLDAIASTLGWPYGQLWLVDDVSHTLRPIATWSRDETRFDLRRGPLAPGQGLAGAVWSRSGPLWMPDLSNADDRELAEAADRCGLRAALGLPILGENTVRGVLVVFSEASDALPGPIVALLSAMAAHLGAYLARRHARGLAVELGRSRDDFLSLAGHAMRTPLTSIAAYTDLLLSQTTDEQDRHLLTVIARHTKSLRRIIDDLLELAALQSGHLTLERRPTDLVPLIQEVIKVVGPLARQNEVEFDTDLPDDAPVEGDPGRLVRVLDNLLSNAVKYSPDGGKVQIRVLRTPDTVDITVADRGVGVPDDERERLFQRFFRARNALELGVAGSGLGLTTARAIVEAHGGQISVAARRDEPGTVVTVRLPLRRA